MRIAIVGTELCAVDSRGGGLEQVLRGWASSLAGHHEVIVVSHQPGGRALASGDDPYGDDPYETVAVAETSDLAAVLRRIGADVVSLHNRPQWVAHCGATLATVTFHNYPPAWKLPTGTWPPPAAFSAVSSALADAAAIRLSLHPHSIAVTPPPIDRAFCAPRDWNPAPVVLFPNRLMRKKGVLELLEVAVRPEFTEIQFAFADLISPWLRPTAEHRASRSAVRAVANAVLFAPTHDAAELAERYAAAAVVACPVREPEGLGLVPLEAQACGAPVVTTDLGGLREATFPPNACVVAGDPDALASALLEALHRSVAAPGPRQAVLERHAPEASAAVYERWLSTAF